MSIFFVILFAFVIYADFLDFIPFVHYWDEAVTILVPVLFIIRYKKIRKDKAKTKCFFILFAMIMLGLLGNIIHPGIQEARIAIFKDILLFVKFPLLMLLLGELGDRINYRKWRKHVKGATYVSKFTIVLAFFMAIIGRFIDIGVYTGSERLLPEYRFVYSHPTYLVASIVFCIAVLICENKNKNKFYIYIGCIVLFLSQRFKAYAILIIILVLVSVKDSFLKKMFSLELKSKIKKRYVVPILLATGIAFYFVFVNKFNQYLEWGMTSARIALHVVALKIGIDFFPIGSGFGTYASFLSGTYYSNIYAMYGISRVQGIRREEYNYISDTFWPWIVGEFGFIATIMYGYMMIYFIKSQLSKIKNYNKLVAFIIMWSYGLLASTMEAFFSNETAVEFAIVISLFIATDNDDSAVLRVKDIYH